MDLGQRIAQLRQREGLSQSQLADELEVSRQSVSKWETGASMPDLEKLCKLSKRFQVSLDELVKGEAPEPEAPTPGMEVASQASIPPVAAPARRTVPALILACTGSVLLVLLLLLGGGWVAFVLALLFLLSAGVTISHTKHPVLWSIWAFHLGISGLISFSTSIRWQEVLRTLQYQESWGYGILLFSWLLVLVRVVLVWRTLAILRREGNRPSQRTLVAAVLAAVVLCLLPDPFQWWKVWDAGSQVWLLPDGLEYPVRVLRFLREWVRLFGGTLCAAVLVRFRYKTK